MSYNNSYNLRTTFHAEERRRNQERQQTHAHDQRQTLARFGVLMLMGAGSAAATATTTSAAFGTAAGNGLTAGLLSLAAMGAAGAVDWLLRGKAPQPAPQPAQQQAQQQMHYRPPAPF